MKCWQSAALAGCVLAYSANVFAVEYDIHAETYAQAYQARGPYGAPIISARRLTQILTFSTSHQFDDGRGPTVLFRFRLRFDGQFGDNCGGASGRCLDETNFDRTSDWVQGYARRSVDIPYAYLAVNGLAKGRVDFRLGRMMTTDVLGFFLHDGALTRFNVLPWLSLEAYGGLEVRGGFPLSDSRFERDGAARADRGAWDPSVAPWIADRPYAPIVALALEGRALGQYFARATYRRVWSREGVAEEKLGASVDAAPLVSLRLSGRAVFSVPQRLLSVLGISAEWRQARSLWSLRAGIERLRPSFDQTTIWNAFWMDPIDEARGVATVQLHPTTHITVTGLGRRYALSEAGPSANAASVVDQYTVGATGALTLQKPSWEFTVRGTAEGGSLAARGGVDVQTSFQPWRDRVLLNASISLWTNSEPLRAQRNGTSVAIVGGGVLRLTPFARLHVDAELDSNPMVGQRFRVMSSLVLSAQP